MIDLDSLKYANDKYGYTAGEYSLGLADEITQISCAMMFYTKLAEMNSQYCILSAHPRQILTK